ARDVVNTLILKENFFLNFHIPITDYWKLKANFTFESAKMPLGLTLNRRESGDCTVARNSWDFPPGIVGKLLAELFGRKLKSGTTLTVSVQFF
ncbi:MAG: hypothetical protein RLP02_35105, partial [Coleofasciculus sp. C2-GNP5-27]